MATNSSIPPATTDFLKALESHVDGRPVLYATKFVRPEEKLQGASSVALARFAVNAAFKQASRAIASGVPSEGWLIATPVGLHVFKKTTFGAIGKPLGTLPNSVISGVSVAHGKKPTKTQITITMVDQSSAGVWVRTAETYPALSPWIRGASASRSPDQGLSERLPTVPDAPIFDADELLGSLHH